MKMISMGGRLSLALAMATTVVVVLVVGGFYALTSAELEKTFASKIEQTLSYLSGTLSPILWNIDQDTASLVAESVLRDEFVVRVIIRDERGEEIVSRLGPSEGVSQAEIRPLLFRNRPVGEVEVYFSRAPLADSLIDIFWIGLSIWLLAMISISVLTSLLIRKYFRAPLAALTELAEAYRQNPAIPATSATPFIEFKPIEDVMRKLANDISVQLIELQESEAHFRSIFENALYGIAITGPNYELVEVNDAWCDLIGYSKSELIGKMSIKDVTVPDNLQNTVNQIEKLISREITEFNLEKSYRTKSGEIKSCLTFVKGVYDEQGRYVGNAATVLDITEHNRAAAALKDSEAKYRRIFETIEEGYFSTNLDGEILSVNPSGARLLKYDGPEDLIGKNILHEVYVDSRQGESVKESLMNSLNVKDQRLEFRQRDGNIITIERNAHLVFGDDGGPITLEGTFKDVTEQDRLSAELAERRKSLEDQVVARTAELNAANEQLHRNINELTENRAKYYDLYENSPDSLMSVDMESRRIVECNSRVSRTIGLPREEIIGRDILDFYDEDYQEQAVAAFETVIKEGEIHDVELKVKCADGSTIDVLLDAAAFLDIEGKAQHTRSSWTDISRRMQYEADLQEANQRLEDLDRLKSMFIASVSHELRTPLNSIIGFSGMILNGLSGEVNVEQVDGLNRVNRAGKHLLSLITDVIDISAIEAGELSPFPEYFSMESIVDEAVDIVQPELIAQGLELNIDAPSWPNMYTDRTRLLQCLLNYLSNAIKYTEAGSVALSIREEGDRVDISVRDTGIGMARENLPKLFTAFERLDSDLRIKAGGTGLGLHLVKKIARDVLEGDVSVESQLGEGSVFSLHIPKEIMNSESKRSDEMIAS